jgi:hypothetical protein
VTTSKPQLIAALSHDGDRLQLIAASEDDALRVPWDDIADLLGASPAGRSPDLAGIWPSAGGLATRAAGDFGSPRRAVSRVEAAGWRVAWITYGAGCAPGCVHDGDAAAQQIRLRQAAAA